MPLYALGDDAPALPEPGRFWIAPDAQVIGRVRLGPDASVWFGAVLRGDNEWLEVGAGSNVQDGAVLHADPGFPLVVGDGVTIGHRAIVHGCAIGAGSLIGMGATVLNGARIGASCLVGANALVGEGKHFPDHSLIVGNPARIARTFDPPIADRLHESAQHYVRNWRRFAAELRRLD